jgi:hypothetical protein
MDLSRSYSGRDSSPADRRVISTATTSGELARHGRVAQMLGESCSSRLVIPLYWRALRLIARPQAQNERPSDEIPSRVEAMGLGDVKYLATVL